VSFYFFFPKTDLISAESDLHVQYKRSFPFPSLEFTAYQQKGDVTTHGPVTPVRDQLNRASFRNGCTRLATTSIKCIAESSSTVVDFPFLSLPTMLSDAHVEKWPPEAEFREHTVEHKQLTELGKATD